MKSNLGIQVYTITNTHTRNFILFETKEVLGMKFAVAFKKVGTKSRKFRFD